MRVSVSGGIAQSIRIAVGGNLHEFGKPGKLVSAKGVEAVLRAANDLAIVRKDVNKCRLGCEPVAISLLRANQDFSARASHGKV
jgi:hypothetical protein